MIHTVGEGMNGELILVLGFTPQDFGALLSGQGFYLQREPGDASDRLPINLLIVSGNTEVEIVERVEAQIALQKEEMEREGEEKRYEPGRNN